MKTEIELALPTCAVHHNTLTVHDDVSEWWTVLMGENEMANCDTAASAIIIATALNAYVQDKQLKADLEEINAELQCCSETNK
mgnify:FL=1